jgi:DNA-binding MarR family transcriptional regulator
VKGLADAHDRPHDQQVIHGAPRGTGRTIALELTEQGRTLLAKAQEIAANVESEVLGSLDADEIAMLHVLLRKILSSA